MRKNKNYQQCWEPTEEILKTAKLGALKLKGSPKNFMMQSQPSISQIYYLFIQRIYYARNSLIHLNMNLNISEVNPHQKKFVKLYIIILLTMLKEMILDIIQLINLIFQVDKRMKNKHINVQQLLSYQELVCIGLIYSGLIKLKLQIHYKYKQQIKAIIKLHFTLNCKMIHQSFLISKELLENLRKIIQKNHLLMMRFS